MTNTESIKRFFHSVDKKDITSFASFITEDVSFKFGNADAVRGKIAVSNMVQQFFDSINGLTHKIDNVWFQDNAVICNGQVTYTRHDSSQLTVPFANILEIDNDLISDYQIYIDTSQLYMASESE